MNSVALKCRSKSFITILSIQIYLDKRSELDTKTRKCNEINCGDSGNFQLLREKICLINISSK